MILLEEILKFKIFLNNLEIKKKSFYKFMENLELEKLN